MGPRNVKHNTFSSSILLFLRFNIFKYYVTYNFVINKEFALTENMAETYEELKVKTLIFYLQAVRMEVFLVDASLLEAAHCPQFFLLFVFLPLLICLIPPTFVFLASICYLLPRDPTLHPRDQLFSK